MTNVFEVTKMTRRLGCNDSRRRDGCCQTVCVGHLLLSTFEPQVWMRQRSLLDRTGSLQPLDTSFVFVVAIKLKRTFTKQASGAANMEALAATKKILLGCFSYDIVCSQCRVPFDSFTFENGPTILSLKLSPTLQIFLSL